MAHCVEAKVAKDIPLYTEKQNGDIKCTVIPKDETITVSRRDCDYILFHGTGWWSLDSSYVGEVTAIISEN